MLKRFFRKIGLSYKRARRDIFKDTKWKTYWDKVAQIKGIKGFVEKGLCDLYFFDESGFSLHSNVPYTWSEVGNPTRVPSDRFAKRINVLGFLNTKNRDLFYEMRTGSVDSEITVALFDKFADRINGTPTIVILDNASMHTSKLFKSNIEKWEKKGLHLLYLPPYSPELNLIEILWREMKYRWFDLNAFSSFEKLWEHVKKLLDGFGLEYDIILVRYLARIYNILLNYLFHRTNRADIKTTKNKCSLFNTLRAYQISYCPSYLFDAS
jgi:transposase